MYAHATLDKSKSVTSTTFRILTTFVKERKGWEMEEASKSRTVVFT